MHLVGILFPHIKVDVFDVHLIWCHKTNIFINFNWQSIEQLIENRYGYLVHRIHKCIMMWPLRGVNFFFSLCLSTKTYSWYIEYLGVLSDNGYKYFNGNMYMYSYLNSRLCFLLPYWSPVIRFDTGRLLTLYIHGWHILPSAYVKMCFYVYYICMYIYIYIY